MNHFHCSWRLLGLLLPCVLFCGCLPTTQPDAKASLQALQQQGAAPSSEAPPLQTALDPEEQDRFRLDYARLLMDGGRDGEAEALLDRLRHDDKLAPEAYPLLAKVYERRNRPREALLAWQKALSLRAGDPEVMARVARAALVCREYPVAEAIFGQWLVDNPAGSRLHIAALNNLGFSSLLQQKYEQAAGFLGQAIALDPLNQRARANLALLERVRKDGPAATPLELSPEASLLPVVSLPLDKQKKKRSTALDPDTEPSSLSADKGKEEALTPMASTANPAMRLLRAVQPPENKDDPPPSNMPKEESTP